MGPKPIATDDSTPITAMEDAHLTNTIWALACLSNQQYQHVSSWTGFNIQLRSGMEIEEDNIAYLPTVNAPATDLSTVQVNLDMTDSMGPRNLVRHMQNLPYTYDEYLMCIGLGPSILSVICKNLSYSGPSKPSLPLYEVLKRSLKIMQMLDLHVFYQALYAKACEVAWKNQELFSPIVLRMGTFHTICTFLAVIGKRYGEAGLRDLAVESGVIADGSIAGMLDGRKYNGTVRLRLKGH